MEAMMARRDDMLEEILLLTFERVLFVLLEAVKSLGVPWSKGY